MKIRSAISVVATCLVFIHLTALASAQEAFYSGKTIIVIAPSNPGGGIDAYSRLVARHIGRHIQGAPNVLVRNMPGAGGVVALNHLTSIAPQDGTVILNLNPGNLIHEAIGAPGMKGSLRTLQWLGDLSRDNPVDITYPHSKVKTIQDAQRMPVRVGATGVGSSPALIAWTYKALLGAQYEVIMGYSGAGEYDLAIQRGELDGRSVTSFSSYMAGLPEEIRPKINLLVQLGVEKDPNVPPHVPLLLDLVRGDPVKEPAARFVSLVLASINRPFAVGPNVPSSRAAILQMAFDDTMRDERFIFEAKKMGATLAPSTGAQVKAVVDEALSFPPEIMTAVMEALAPALGQSK